MKLSGNIYLKIISLSVPSVFSLLVVSLYAICDTYFLSRLGVVSLGGVCYPVVAVMQGIVMTFAFGSANNISAKIGEGDFEKAKEFFFSGLFGVLIFAGGVGCIVGIFSREIVDFISCGNGDSGGGSYLAVQGFSLLLFGVYFYFSAILRSEGRAGVVMVASLLGLICNLVLDYFAVEVLLLGSYSIAVATCGAQIIAGVVLVFAVAKSKICSFDFAFFGFSRLYNIILLGSSSFFRQLMGGLSAIALNFACGKLGGELLAGVTVSAKVSVLLFSFGLGLGQGMQPVIAYYFGKGDFVNIRKGAVFTLIFAACLGVLIGVVQFCFASQIAEFFACGNEGALGVSKQILQTTAFSVAFSFVLVVINMAFQACGRKFLNIFLSVLRQGLIFIPVLLILSQIFGRGGVIFSHLVSDVISGVIGIVFVILWLKSDSENDNFSKN